MYFVFWVLGVFLLYRAGGLFFEKSFKVGWLMKRRGSEQTEGSRENVGKIRLNLKIVLNSIIYYFFMCVYWYACVFVRTYMYMYPCKCVLRDRSSVCSIFSTSFLRHGSSMNEECKNPANFPVRLGELSVSIL